MERETKRVTTVTNLPLDPNNSLHYEQKHYIISRLSSSSWFDVITLRFESLIRF